MRKVYFGWNVNSVRRQLFNELRRQTYAIVFFHNQVNYARFVGGCEWRCAHVDPVITVRVLCLFHNNKSGYSWHAFIAETMYSLLNTKLLLLVMSWCPNWLVKLNRLISNHSCTVLCKTLNLCLWQVSLSGDSRSLIGRPVGVGGAPNFNVVHLREVKGEKTSNAYQHSCFSYFGFKIRWIRLISWIRQMLHR